MKFTNVVLIIIWLAHIIGYVSGVMEPMVITSVIMAGMLAMYAFAFMVASDW